MGRNKKQQRNREENNAGQEKKPTSSRKKQKLNSSTPRPRPSFTEKSKNDDDSSPPSETWSKSKKKRMRAIKAKMLKKQQGNQGSNSKGSSKSSLPSPAQQQQQQQQGGGDKETGKVSSKLQDAFKARLTGSRFRILNEELYTKESKESFARFSQNPELFEQYHEGFRHQVESWPVNPVDTIVRWISSNYMKKDKCIVADFGCGDAQIAKDLLKVNAKTGKDTYIVHSFDLVSQNELVTACDMANVPIGNKSVDVVVFSLALMGTNLADFIREAHRVLKDNGRVKIAEVRSRIEYKHAANKGKKSGDGPSSNLSGTLEEFVEVLKKLGFDCARTDRSNKMFLFLELKKNGKTPNKTLEFSAKPCIYKRR